MSNQRFPAAEIKGFTPALDVVDSDAQYVIGGKNYIFDSKGPKSGFGDRLLEPMGFHLPQYIQGHRLKLSGGNISLTINVDGIWMWDEFKGYWFLVYQTLDTSDTPYRWTFGYVAGLVFMCHPKTGILVYYPDTKTIAKHALVANVTVDNAIALCDNNGRLCVMSDTVMAWSGPGDGLDFSPALGGAGEQVINERVPGTPIMITSYAGGCLTWTSGGVLRSEFTGDVYVYRHKPLATDYRMVNSFCAISIDSDTTVILDPRGLFQTQGDIPQPYDAIMNEYLIEFIRDNSLAQDNRLRLEYDENSRRLFVSAAMGYATQGFDTCYVQYQPLQKWGEFNEFHYGILPLDLNAGAREGSYAGFCDSQGCVRIWSGGSNREADRSADNQGLYNTFVQSVDKSLQYNDDHTATVIATTCKAHGFDSSNQLYVARSGFYLPDANSPSPAVPAGLDSQVQIGLFRPLGQDSVHHMSEVIEILIRTQDSADPDSVTVDDLMLDDGTEDYALESGEDDYGDYVPEFIQEQVLVTSSLDGKNPFQSVQAQLVKTHFGARYYACSSVGLWHTIQVSALVPGESFHIKGFELTATDAGRFA